MKRDPLVYAVRVALWLLAVWTLFFVLLTAEVAWYWIVAGWVILVAVGFAGLLIFTRALKA